MLICGMGGLRAVGVWYSFMNLSAKTLTTMNLSSMGDAVQGTLLFLSVACAVIMFGISGEYHESGHWAIAAAYGFQAVFSTFVVVEVIRILRRVETDETRAQYTVESLTRRRQTPIFTKEGTASFGSNGEKRAKVGKRASLWDGGTRGLTITSHHSSMGYKEDLEGAQKSKKLDDEEGAVAQLDFNPGFF